MPTPAAGATIPAGPFYAPSPAAAWAARRLAEPVAGAATVLFHSVAIFYLPEAERERLLMMARKLYRFSSLLMIPALGLGLWLWLGNRTAYAGGWLQVKLLLVVLVIGYHHACRSLLRAFEQFNSRRSERWFRVFNESAVLLFAAIVVLVVVKPF